jgi:hypothetical protein
MSFRALLVLAILIGLLVYYFGNPRAWWSSMTRAAQEIHRVAGDSIP